MEMFDRLIIGLNNKAESARQMGDTETAAEKFHQAIQLINAYGAAPSTEASVCTNFGLFMGSMGLHSEAIALQRRALELDMKSGASKSDLGFSHHNLGFTLKNAGQVSEGIEHLLKAARLRESIDDFDELVITYEALGDACLLLNELDKAEKHAARGLALKSKLRRPHNVRTVLSVMAEVAARKGDWNAAAELQAQVIEHLEQMRSVHHEVAKLDQFDSRYNKRYLTAIEHLLQAGRHLPALVLIDRTRFRSGCDAIDQPSTLGSPLKLDSLILPQIRDGELMLVEWVYPKFEWSFAISRRQKEIKARKITTSFKEGPPVGLDLENQWPVHFANLLSQSQHVVDAYRDELKEVSRVVYFPHGTQWQAPFAALNNPNTGKRLLETHELLISPSLRYCAITDKRAKLSSQDNLVLGDPTEDLPGARSEAKSVAKKLACRPILGRELTKKRVCGLLAGGVFNVVHFSGHGIYTSDDRHGLVLSDGILTDQEVMECKFSANLVNLANCWGGMASFSIWNELHGFVRTLLICGTRNVIGSTYPLGDKVAHSFNDAFYDQYVGESRPPISAFRSAVLAIPSDSPVEDWGGLYVTGQR